MKLFYKYDEIKSPWILGGTFIDETFILNEFKDGTPTELGNVSGKFAFALELDGSIILGTDHFSFIPVYFIIKNSNCYFSDNIKDLVSILKKVTFNKKVLQEFTFEKGEGYFFDKFENETLYNEINVVGPNSYVKINKSNGSFINITYPRNTVRSKNLKELLFKSVKKFLGEKEPKYASQLSGGLDSTGVSSMLEGFSKKEGFKTFYLSFKAKYPEMDESFFVEEFKKKYSVYDNHIYTSQVTNELKSLNKYISTYYTPPMSVTPISYLLEQLEEVKKAGSKVIFSGEGGDQVLGKSLRIGEYYFENKMWPEYKKYIKNVVSFFDYSRGVPNWNTYSSNKKYNFYLFSKLFHFNSKFFTSLAFRNPASLIQLSVNLIFFLQYLFLKFLKIKDKIEEKSVKLSKFTSPVLGKLKYNNLEDLKENYFHIVHNKRNVEINNYKNNCAKLFGAEFCFPFFDKDLIDFFQNDANLFENFDSGNHRKLYKTALSEVLPHEVATRQDKVYWNVFVEEHGEKLISEFVQNGIELPEVLWNYFHKDICMNLFNSLKSGNYDLKFTSTATLVGFVRIVILINTLQKDGIEIN